MTQAQAEFLRLALKEALKEGLITEKHMEDILLKLEGHEVVSRDYARKILDALDSVMSKKEKNAVPA